MKIEKKPETAPVEGSFIPSARLTRKDVLLAAGLAFLFTLMALQWSFTHGRLAVPPTFDDITYFCDAIERLRLFYTDGLAALAKNYIAVPPHAPLSTGLAFVAFLLFGVHEWAPYALNGILIFILFLFALRLTSDLTLPRRLLLLFFLATIPVALMGVTEFRPDFGAGLLTAMGIIWTIGMPIHAASRRHMVQCGVLFGCALVAKPSIFPFTLFMWGCSIAAATLCEMWVRRSWRIPQGTVVKIVPALAVGAGIALFYFAFALKEIIAYVHMVVASKSSNYWLLPGGLSAQLQYYIFGMSGRAFLGDSVWLLLGLIFAATAVMVFTARKSVSIRWLAMLALLVITYAFPTANKVKSEFFAITFQTFIALCGMMSLRNIASWLAAKKSFSFAGVPLMVLMVLVGANWLFPGLSIYGAYGTRGYTNTEKSWRNLEVGDAVLHAVEKYSDGKDTKVFFTAVGEVGPKQIEWLAAKETGLHEFLKTDDVEWNNDMDLFKKETAHAHLVVAADDGASGVYTHMPSAKSIGEMLKVVKDSPDFIEVAQIPDGDGKFYHVFKNAAFCDFIGWKEQEGFVAYSPYEPQFSLPNMRLMNAPVSAILPDGIAPGHCKLIATCWAPVDAQQMTITYGGKTLQTVTLTGKKPVNIEVEFDCTDVTTPIRFEFGKEAIWAFAAAFPKLKILATGANGAPR